MDIPWYLYIFTIMVLVFNHDQTGMLLEHTVGNLDPLYIVKEVPDGLEIPRLRDRLMKIINDYRIETSLRHGCNDNLKTDRVNLLVKVLQQSSTCEMKKTEDDTSSERASNSINTTEVGVQN